MAETDREDRIKIANETLSALLLQGADDPFVHGEEEEGRDASGRKIYVDWPDDNDDQEYRFVSSRVEDYPEGLTPRHSPPLYDSLDAEGYTSQPALPPPHQTHHVSQPVHQPTHYVGQPAREPPDPVPRAPSHQTALSHHSRTSIHSLNRGSPSKHSKSMVTPMPERHKEITSDEEERQLLEEEARYQEYLKQRLHENEERANELNIPPLRLDEIEQSGEFANDLVMDISVRSQAPQVIGIPQNKMPAGVARFSDFVDSLDAENERWEENAGVPEPLESDANGDESNGIPYQRREEYQYVNVRVEERTVPRDDRTVPRDDRTVPRDERTVPRDERTVPRDDRTVPRDEDYYQPSVEQYADVHNSPDRGRHSEMRHQQPEMRHPQPEMRHQQPEMRHPQPEMRHQQPEMRLYQPEMRHYQPEMRPVLPEQPIMRQHHRQQPEVRSQPSMHPVQPENRRISNGPSREDVHHREVESRRQASPVRVPTDRSERESRGFPQRYNSQQTLPSEQRERYHRGSPNRHASPQRYPESRDPPRVPEPRDYVQPRGEPRDQMQQPRGEHAMQPRGNENRGIHISTRNQRELKTVHNGAPHERYPTVDNYPDTSYPDRGYPGDYNYPYGDRPASPVRGLNGSPVRGHLALKYQNPNQNGYGQFSDRSVRNQASSPIEPVHEGERKRRFSDASLHSGRITPAHKLRESHRSMEEIYSARKQALEAHRRQQQQQAQEQKPITNYIEKNKQTYGFTKKDSGYAKYFNRKQEHHHHASSAPSRILSRKPPLPGIKPGTRSQREDTGDSSRDDEPSSNPEQLWAQRSKALSKRVDPRKPRQRTGSVPEFTTMVDSESEILRNERVEPQKVSIDLNVNITPQGFTIPEAFVKQGDAGATQYVRPYADPYVLDKAFRSPRDLSLQERTPSDLDKLVYSQTQTNPFTPLPPILNDNNQDEEDIPKDGYLAKYRKEHEQQTGGAERNYKPYSYSDYKRMQKNVKLGGLGPDLDNDEYKEKVEKRLRAEAYARQARERNLQTRVKPKPKPAQPSPPRAEPLTRDVFSPSIVVKTSSRRQAAIEYAKQLQRPSSKTTPKKAAPKPKPKPKPEPEPEMIDLKRLLERHERDKENVATVRAKLLEVP